MIQPAGKIVKILLNVEVPGLRLFMGQADIQADGMLGLVLLPLEIAVARGVHHPRPSAGNHVHGLRRDEPGEIEDQFVVGIIPPDPCRTKYGHPEMLFG